MKLSLAALSLLILTGCATSVPVTARFPDPPGTLVSQPCGPLTKLADDASISDISRTVTQNYSQYYECAVKLDAWIQWYGIQKTIYEKVK